MDTFAAEIFLMPTMTAAEARAILDRWERRQPGEHPLVVKADRLLERLWRKRKARGRKHLIA